MGSRTPHLGLCDVLSLWQLATPTASLAHHYRLHNLLLRLLRLPTIIKLHQGHPSLLNHRRSHHLLLRLLRLPTITKLYGSQSDLTNHHRSHNLLLHLLRLPIIRN
jgi:ABC-type transport system involved in cytochrome c biogenesis permease component